MSKTVVIKLGSSVLTGGGAKLDRGHMQELARQCALLHTQGHDLILCTSGAIVAGRERLGMDELPATLASKQMLAAVGQSRLMLLWESLFETHEIHVGQMLLTRADVSDRKRFLNAQDTIQALLARRIVPIVNENDAVATAEIKLGDNDTLSALVVLLAEADLLLLLTDQLGLFDSDPRKNPDAQLIQEVETIDDALRTAAGGTSGGLGVGGMATKLESANLARRSGADVVIASGHAPDVITRVLDGESVGTRFSALASPLQGRKRWILAGPAPAGSVVIDAGAARALSENGRSLLPTGIESIRGSFARGDTVSVLDASGKELARGLVRYPSAELEKIRGCHSDQIVKKLGYAYGPVAVHRDDLILT